MYLDLLKNICAILYVARVASAFGDARGQARTGETRGTASSSIHISVFSKAAYCTSVFGAQGVIPLLAF